MKDNNSTTFIQNPKIDYLFGMYGGKPIPTKQDKFSPANVTQLNEDGTEEAIRNFYTKNPDSPSVIEFTSQLREIAYNIFKDGKRIEKPNLIEVIISISVTEKRFKEVDIDNLSKCVLDALNTVAFEDDSQVVSLIANKHVHDMKLNALLIGITKLTNERQGFGGDIKLYSKKQ